MSETAFFDFVDRWRFSRVAARSRSESTYGSSPFERKALSSLNAQLSQDGRLTLEVRGTLTFLETDWFWSETTSHWSLAMAMNWARLDPRVRETLLVVTSPGGTVAGVSEAESALMTYKSSGKPLKVLALGENLSAAYWLSSYADKILATPSTYVGSIGAYRAHLSYAKQFEKEGIEIKLFRSGEKKLDGNPYESLPERVAIAYQAEVDSIRARFVETVKRNRPQSSRYEEEWSSGAIYSAQDALRFGLLDEIVLDLREAISRSSGASSNAISSNDLTHRVMSEQEKNEAKTESPSLSEMSERVSPLVDDSDATLAERVKALETLSRSLEEERARAAKESEALRMELERMKSQARRAELERDLSAQGSRVGRARLERLMAMYDERPTPEMAAVIREFASMLPDELPLGAAVSSAEASEAESNAPRASLGLSEEEKKIIVERANARVKSVRAAQKQWS